jgi:hypothetical protein
MSRITFIPARGKSVQLLARNPVFRAIARNPMNTAMRNNVELPAQIAFKSVQEGAANDADRTALATMCNVIMVLAEKHCSQSDLDDAIEAQMAIVRADRRAAQGKHWNFDGEGRLAMIQALATHQQQITQLGQVAITDAMLEVLDRKAKGQVFTVGAEA